MEGDRKRASATAAHFALATDAPQCDLVLKGGVTSGIVYPRAILEVAKKYRLRSIGGASAGAIAAAFAAAAEYARRRGDLEGYVRLDQRCENLPPILAGLFQPAPHLRPLLQAGLGLTSKTRPRLRALWSLRWILAMGAGLGAAAYAGLLAAASLLTPEVWGLAALPGLVFAVLCGMLVYLAFRLGHMLFFDLPKRNFGLCSGMSDEAGGPQALTEWIHASLQYIAFGDQPPERPLTFGDLEGGGEFAGLEIDLRAMTTNLSMQRPEVMPRTELDLHFDPVEWRTLFPQDVRDYLETGAASPTAPHLRALPKSADLPVIVAIRMSLSFPVLIQAVPLWLMDKDPNDVPLPPARLWFSDGGITSNFPIHFFDALLPSRPTFAFSLDDLPAAHASPDRVSMPQDEHEGSRLPIHEMKGLGGFTALVFGSAKDWQDQMQSVLPGQRQRIVRIKLDRKTEGGLNLAMGSTVSENLMDYGEIAGQMVRDKFDFVEHRWRRVLVAYEQLEVLTGTLSKTWPKYADWYPGYVPLSYKGFELPDRQEIGRRLGALTTAGQAMAPPLEASFPRPTGRLHTTPEL